MNHSATGRGVARDIRTSGAGMTEWLNDGYVYDWEVDIKGQSRVGSKVNDSGIKEA